MRPRAVPSEKPWSIRAYTAGDEQGILRLFSTVFGAERSLDHWRWQYEQNPYGIPVSFLAVSVAGEIVCQHGVMPLAINVRGRQVLGCQVLDTMVHPDFRRMGLMEETAHRCFAHLASSGYSLAFAFPNQNSYPGFVRKLGWQRVIFGDGYSTRLSIQHAVRKLLPVPTIPYLFNLAYRSSLQAMIQARTWHESRGHASSVSESDRVPEGYDELWDEARSFEIFSIWKDAAYFSWRYDKNPSHLFRYFYIREGQKIVALAVVNNEDGLTRITELVTRRHDIPLARQLVARIVLEALRQGSTRVQFNGNDSGCFREIFRGFQKRTNPSHVLCVRPLAEPKGDGDYRLPHNWSITDGDGDSL